MKIEAEPADSLYDEPVRIRLSGFPPRREVTFKATAFDAQQRRWSSHATFETDVAGTVDMAVQAPISGTWDSPDPSGALWSMRLDDEAAEPGGFSIFRPDPIQIQLAAELDGTAVATAQLTRRFLVPGIIRREIRDEGLHGTFMHLDGAPRPGVLLVGGSGGGLAEDQPALLASRGYAVLSLAYFMVPGLPTTLTEIPLEYFERALNWMKRNPAVQTDRLAVIGASRGGELALLLASMFRDIKAVVAYVPSGIVWPGIGATPTLPAWTWRGRAITAIEPAAPDPSLWSMNPAPMTPWFLESLKNRDSAERAAIEVEKINGPVLMFSATDDRMWPSLNLADMAVQRMNSRGFPHPYEHVSYAGAGHFIRFPYYPVITEIFHPLTKRIMALGGSPHANHVANLDSWHRCLSFLARFLG